ncbi:LolA family protein [Acetobacter oeni]|uniref:Outer-membrane lipoprotein carrier protein n=1 Tax=Acetobacter oeni TaxID=304077 RepID=A0A511XGJ9_9PROT|nr:outer membrane lipoprotein carrier protein LolA [Acetobacter oeni]MBB3881749.1 outer membrane lipoprotein-sorting protein [Acetobacter oeni]NHO17449.1 outer membrane lipoprotein carrier protein LolA [Acetobacter oeni]GBR01924.1 outer-membrane lipoprotein carrier protein [Acetobacter oeni LMG 21952]GEN62080.1 outer-membrane lipoprotein carrier protein [Acetobacter oeni]
MLLRFPVYASLIVTGVFLLTGNAEIRTSYAATSQFSPVDQGWIDRVQDKMNSVVTMRGRFEQTAADGQKTTGDVWLSRPGRMRFQYDKPSPLLLVANDGKVIFRDSQLDQITEIPIERTPLGLLLGAHISLSGDVTVTSFRKENGVIQISAVRTTSPGEGTLVMAFDEKSLSMLGWIVVDAQGRQTQVRLSDLVSGADTPSKLFILPKEN